MRKILLFFLLLLLSLPVLAQEAAPVLTHFREDHDIENQNWAICQDKNKVMLFANRKGILAFYGTEHTPDNPAWISIRIQVTPYSMEMNPYDKRIYIGGENDYGFIEKDHKGIYRYESLNADSAELGIITGITFNDSIACFAGAQSVSCYNFRTGKLASRHIAGNSNPFTGIIMKGGSLFVNISKLGLHRAEADSLYPTPSGYLTVSSEILFTLPHNEKSVVVGLSNSKISLFDGNRFSAFNLNDDGYIENNMLSGGICIGDSLYAFATVGGGAVVADRAMRRVKFVINNQKGLPDDEILAMGQDASGGLWLSHPFGITRADLRLPVGNYGIYEGLTGNLSAAIRYSGELYAATSDGVYYLAPEKNYDEVRLLRNEIEPVKMSVQIQKETPQPKIRPSRQEDNTRKSIFNRIFGKRSEEADVKEEEEANSSILGSVNVREVPEIRYRTDTIRTLKSITYMFKKVTGLDLKCRQLVPTDYGILAATNMGLYVIRNHKAELIAPDRYINYIGWNSFRGSWSVAASDGYFTAEFKKGKWTVDVPDKNFREPVYSIVRTGQNTFWLGCDNSAYYRYTGEQAGDEAYSRFTVGNNFSQRYLVRAINDSIFLFTDTGISVFDEDSDEFVSYKTDTLAYGGQEVFGYPLSNIPLIISGNNWVHLGADNTIKEKSLSILRLFENVSSVYSEGNNIWIVDGQNRLYGIDCSKSSAMTPETDLFIKNVRNDKGMSFNLSDIVFERGDNIIEFDIVAPAYHSKVLTQYQFNISKIMDDWSPWSMDTRYKFPITKPGNYTLQIRAMDAWGQVGEPVSINFTIKAPFTKTTPFYFLLAFSGLLVILAVIYFRERQLQEKNRILEERVKERTAEIAAQKEEITASIAYASRIQMAMLPVSNLFTESFSDFFIMFKPRDIVSGDFYWIGEDEKNLYLTVADCTGHGVPGAFMSTLGISLLNEIVTHNKNLQASTFLNLLREKIKTLLHQTGKEGEAADGMDISLCVINKTGTRLQYAGAYNPIFIHTDGSLREYKADRMPIGIHYGSEVPFRNYEININRGDVIYLLSDGLTDQFGGREGSKYKKAQLKKLLSRIHNTPMAEQQRLVEEEFISWKGGHEQVDDITVIGVRI